MMKKAMKPKASPITIGAKCGDRWLFAAMIEDSDAAAEVLVGDMM